jgi:hypothetical protein
MRRLSFFVAVAAFAVSACGGSPSSPIGPSAATGLTGAWIGSTSDSTGSMMGAGLTANMMGNTTWTLTQTDGTFSGTMQFAGYGGGTMTVSGTITGRTGTFTMTMSAGSMMMGACAAVATGAFDMDDLMTELHGSYAGMNSCSGAFDNGQLTLTHR